MEIKDETVQLLHDIRGVLRYHQGSSIGEYPASAEFLSLLNTRLAESVSPRQGSQPEKTPGNRPEKDVSSSRSEQNVLAEIAAEVAQCRSCSLAAKRSCIVPGRGDGEKNIRLLIVGHWLSVSEQSARETVFGLEEDLMLARMLAAIHLPMEEVFITNVIKCGVGPESQPQAEHIDACASYLRRQISAAAPEVICTMGMVATRALLGLSQPLSRLRGRFYPYQGSDGSKIPLLPTFHPAYLIQNPEMKNATWLDLQALEKQLQK